MNNTIAIRQTDEVGPITNRMCLACGQYVYENLSQDYFSKFDVWLYLCLWCDERLMAIMTETQAQIDENLALQKRIRENRMRLRQEKAHKKQQEQQTLWELFTD